MDWARERYPKEPADSDFVYKQTIKAKACDAVRGVLPAATLSNVGIYGTGQAYEALLLRMRAHPLPEARTYAAMMLDELRKVIPSFLVPGRPARPRRRVDARTSPRPATTPRDLVERIFGDDEARAAARGRPRRLGPRRRGQGARRDLLPAHRSARGPAARAGAPARRRRSRRVAARVRRGAHATAGTSPGRAFERTGYRFDVLGDYGAFRDLQRHRMLTIEWQRSHAAHGYEVPEAVEEAGLVDAFDDAMERVGRAVRRARRVVPRAGRVRGVARVPDALRDADERA